MKQMVLDVLNRAEIRRIAFSFGPPITINGLSFEPVKTALNNDDITVRYSASLGPGVAKYSHTHDRFSLGFRQLGNNIDLEALIVHEATHAALDAQAVPRLLKRSEAAAYLAQCLYFYYRNEAALQAGAQPTFADPVLRAAWPISEICRRRSSLTDDEVEPLYQAITQRRQYRGRGEDEVAFDGV